MYNRFHASSYRVISREMKKVRESKEWNGGEGEKVGEGKEKESWEEEEERSTNL